MFLIKRKPRAVAEAMKKKAVKEMEEIRNDRNVVFRRIRKMKNKASDLAGNNCIRGKNGTTFYEQSGESTRDHEKWQGQWTNWNCQRAPSCLSRWEASYNANSK